MLDTYSSVFIVGVKGVAMANLASILQSMGKRVAGSDTAETFITDKIIDSSKITVVPSFAGFLIPEDVDLLVYSAAHGGKSNPQVQEAIKRGIPVKHQSEIMSSILDTVKTSIAVAGCHGKTTTAALLAYALKVIGAKPSYLVGVSEFSGERGGIYDENTYFIIEADEYGVNPPEDITPKFHLIHPDQAIITNIDFDHPDVYKNLEDTKSAFQIFMSNVLNKGPNSKLFINIDDDSLKSVVAKLPQTQIVSYGFDLRADFAVKEVTVSENASVFTLQIKGIVEPLVFSTKLFGKKNISNVVGVISCLHTLGYSFDSIAAGIKDFYGAKRRFELVKKIEDIYLYDDYAHHPAEISATIEATRSRFPNSKIMIIFQPHTYSRTIELKDDFVQALSTADQSIILPIFASARENEGEQNITSTDLVKIATGRGYENIYSVENKEELEECVYKLIKPNTIVFTMGAGDVYKLKDLIIPLMYPKL